MVSDQAGILRSLAQGDDFEEVTRGSDQIEASEGRAARHLVGVSEPERCATSRGVRASTD